MSERLMQTTQPVQYFKTTFKPITSVQFTLEQLEMSQNVMMDNMVAGDLN